MTTARSYELRGGRQVELLFDQPFTACGNLVDDVRAAKENDVGVSGTVAAGGGRNGLGRVLVVRALVNIELRRAGIDPDIRITGAKPDTDAAITRWARHLLAGAELAQLPYPDGMPRRGSWHVRPGEDRQLYHYWHQRGEGEIWREVQVGGPGSKTRAIDAVMVAGSRRHGTGPVRWTAPGLCVIEAKNLVRAKPKAFDDVIGQAAGARAAALERGAIDPRAIALVLVLPDDECKDWRVAVGREVGVEVVHGGRSDVVTAVLRENDSDLITHLKGLVESGQTLDRGEALLHLARAGAGLSRSMPTQGD